MKEDIYKIYKITNIINNKIYIGYTKSSIEKRFDEHVKAARIKNSKKVYLSNAINKYGKENFTIVELDKTTSKSFAEELEKQFISIFKSNDSNNGYNLTTGGDSGPQMIKLTEELIINVLNDYLNNFSFSEISKMRNISYYTAFDITRFRFSMDHNIPTDLIEKVNVKKQNSKKRKRLTTEIVQQIFYDFVQPSRPSFDDLGKKYGYFYTHIYDILHRRTFPNVEINKEILDKANKILNSSRFWAKNKQWPQPK